MAGRLDRIGWLPVGMLGAAALVGWVPAVAQTAAARPPEAAPPEIVISAARDQAITARVVQALEEDPYVYAAHISVVTENGVVRLQGIAFDVGDLQRALYLARRASGSRRIVNEIELFVDTEFHD